MRLWCKDSCGCAGIDERGGCGGQNQNSIGAYIGNADVHRSYRTVAVGNML